MGMTANIEIDGKQVPFRASAAIPRIYRIRFHRDIYKDLKSLEGAVDSNDAENSTLDSFSLEMFENIAYVMAKHADKSIPDSPEEWLDFAIDLLKLFMLLVISFSKLLLILPIADFI